MSMPSKQNDGIKWMVMARAWIRALRRHYRASHQEIEEKSEEAGSRE
jgi:hypothetical protein